MPLTDMQCKAYKPESKIKKYFNDSGLYIEVSPKGNKSLKYKDKFLGKEKKLTIGKYPAITLTKARDARREAKKLLADVLPICN